MRWMAVWLAVLAALAARPAAAQTPVPPRERHVVAISLDGFPAYALRDAGIPFPVLRKLMREGAAADALLPVNPTVTWPNHTSMVTGVEPARHGVIFNGLPVRAEGRPMRVDATVEKSQLVEARTVYDAAHDAGLTSAEVDWVAINRAASIDWSFAEAPHLGGPVEKEMVDAGAISEDDLRGWPRAAITLKDDIWTRAAVHILERHKPNLLLMHLLTTDSVQHSYGARSLAANTALILADRQVQRVLDAIDRAGIRSTTTVLVVSDHGFKSYKRAIRPNALLRQLGLLRDRDGQVDCDAFAATEGGTALVYVTREALREATLKTLNQALPKLEGVAQVIPPAEFARYGYPQPSPGGRMADLVLAAQNGYGFEPANTGDPVADVPAGANPGQHGYLNTDPDMQAILVLWGAGVRTGARTGPQPNRSVALTIAQLLGLSLPGADGHALTELLQ